MTSYVWDSSILKWVEKSEFFANLQPCDSSAMVMSDIDPYKSVVTGEVIGGRRQHREHLRSHDLVEVGNEKPRAPQRKYLGNARAEIAQVMRERGVIG